MAKVFSGAVVLALVLGFAGSGLAQDPGYPPGAPVIVPGKGECGFPPMTKPDDVQFNLKFGKLVQPFLTAELTAKCCNGANFLVKSNAPTRVDILCYWYYRTETDLSGAGTGVVDGFNSRVSKIAIDELRRSEFLDLGFAPGSGNCPNSRSFIVNPHDCQFEFCFTLCSQKPPYCLDAGVYKANCTVTISVDLSYLPDTELKPEDFDCFNVEDVCQLPCVVFEVPSD